MGGCGGGQVLADQCDITLEMRNTGSSNAIAIVPITIPIIVIISGSISDVAVRMEFWSFFS